MWTFVDMQPHRMSVMFEFVILIDNIRTPHMRPAMQTPVITAGKAVVAVDVITSIADA